ncbi:methionine adenosyltransferase [Candidatus Ichthyocystis hellenicum]|uniref:methionine adenosyltransferase n=1 Tax=Candidatus Ichthyocystis hellenicum TaxID=1561003 RepID=UPI000B00FDD3|nr:methionine adenosyltransferase [Candidatus Ichthyocystis hellenicum]
MSLVLRTSESVSEGHPDKLADQISDGILDAFLELDPMARVAAETLVVGNVVVLAGEISSCSSIKYEDIVRRIIRNVGYVDESTGINAENCSINVFYGEQSPDISAAVFKGKELGAGDQGSVFGYASNETKSFMPMPIWLAHRLMQRHSEVRRDGRYPWLMPDAKSQVSVRYRDGDPVAVDTIVFSTQHTEGICQEDLVESVLEGIIRPVLPDLPEQGKINFLINPTGRFVIGGPLGDCGLTGRKVIVDTYGGAVPHGGGAFSGKDPSKVDRSAAYAARYVAKNIVAAGLAKRCCVQISYAIGISTPVAIEVETFGTSIIPADEVRRCIIRCFDLTPQGIIETLSLRRPIYAKTAAYGHFGRDEPEFSWETTDKIYDIEASF